MAGEICAILGKIAEFSAAPVGRQFGYLFCFSKNIDQLREEAENLNHMRGGVQQEVEAAKRNVESIMPGVEAWLTKADRVGQEAESIVRDKARAQDGCLNMKLRYTLGRKASKKIQEVVKLQGEGKFEKVAIPGPPPAIDPIISAQGFTGYDSRLSTLNQVLESLKDDRVHLIGICGMGGVGKTTMVKEVILKAKEENIFDEFPFTVVSQNPNLAVIQKQIAEPLGLKLEEENRIVRAGRLHERLQSGKRILVVLDDVWEQFDLQELGIPLGGASKGCKVLFTSRNQDLWSQLEVKKDIKLELLSEDEAWHLFKEKAGGSAEDPSFHPIGKQIVKECACLPLALVVVGSALRNKTVHVWNNTLRQLKQPGLQATRGGVPASVYRSLETSFNFLEEEAKSLLLLCCLFPEDYDIPVELLVRYGVGLKLFNGVNTVEEARDQVCTLINELKASYLLLDGQKGWVREFIHRNGHVKMHDVIRDVAISIASRSNRVPLIKHDIKSNEWPNEGTSNNYYNSISLTCAKTTIVPEVLSGCEKAELLSLTCRSYLDKTKIPPHFFRQMREVKVLHMQETSINLSSLEFFVKSLGMLSLENCDLKDLSAIGGLCNLEILSLSGSNVLELPPQVGMLKKLKVLDISSCDNLERIPRGTIANLVQLQELYMVDMDARSSFTAWEKEEGEGEGKEERRNASLGELESLFNLNTLAICIPDVSILHGNTIVALAKLKKYYIVIGGEDMGHFTNASDKNLFLKLENVMDYTSLTSGMNSLVRSTEDLGLEGTRLKDVACDLIIQVGIQHLKHLYMINIETPAWLAGVFAFPKLEDLKLENLPNLSEMCHVGQSDATNNKRKMEFPKLCKLILDNLPQFFSFSRDINEASFPQLEEVSLSGLPKFNWIFSGTPPTENRDVINLNSFQPCVFPPKLSIPILERLEVTSLPNLEGLTQSPLPVGFLCKLKKISIINCEKILNILPPNLLQRLQNLEELWVYDCSSLETVFELELDGNIKEEEEDLDVEERLSPQFRDLCLRNLPKLKQILKRNNYVGLACFPIPSRMDVVNCHGLRYLFSASNSFMLKKKLQTLHISNCNGLFGIVGDLQVQAEEPMVDKIDFLQLKSLHLQSLRNLLSFFPARATSARLGERPFTLFDKKVGFPCLETLRLSGLPKLRHNGDSNRDPIGFEFIPSVTDLSIRNCDDLRYLFSSANSMMKTIQNIQSLAVDNCSGMLGIVANIESRQGESSEDKMIHFSSLRYLWIDELSNLVSFFPTVLVQSGMQALFDEKDAFPKLEYLFISRLKKVNAIWSTNQHLSFGSFNKLISLRIGYCENLQYLCSISVAKSLVHLQELSIQHCPIMEQVIAMEDEEDTKTRFFTQLKELTLRDLPQLQKFYHTTHDRELPFLDFVHVYNCPELKTFSP